MHITHQEHIGIQQPKHSFHTIDEILAEKQLIVLIPNVAMWCYSIDVLEISENRPVFSRRYNHDEIRIIRIY